MRKALIGLLIATTAASPLAAQDNGWHGRGDGERHQRAEGQQRPQRQERQQAQQQQPQVQQQQRQGGGWQGRQQAQQQQPQVQQQQRQGGGWQGRQQAQQQQQQVQVQQQAVQQQRAYRQGYQGQQGTRGGYSQQQDAYRQQIEASRAANRQVSQGMPERYQRRAAENEANYERQLNQQRHGREGQRSGSYQGRQGYDRQNYQGSRSRVQWNRTWRNDNRYDWQRYRYSNRSIFRSPYYAPRGYGYGYNRLSIGGLLDQIFWGRDYWIGDPYEYRLPPAPYGTQWVRYYNDVVLVDVYTGEVVDVIYDFFW